MDSEVKKRKRGDKLTDHVRILYWYRSIGKALGTLKPEALYREIERDGYPRRYGDAPNSRYLFYSRGKQLPRELIVRKAEEKVSGTKAIFDHVLWRLLREDALVTKRRANVWLKDIDQEVRKLAIFDPFGHIFCWMDERSYEKLERRASLDVLALLTLLILLGIAEGGNVEGVEASARCLQRVLLILGPEFEELGLSNEIFDLFASRIGIPVLRQRHRRLLSTASDYVDTYRMLRAQVRRYAGRANRAIHNDVAVRILRGYINTWLTYLHGPFYELDPDFTGPLSYDDCYVESERFEYIFTARMRLEAYKKSGRLYDRAGTSELPQKSGRLKGISDVCQATAGK